MYSVVASKTDDRTCLERNGYDHLTLHFHQEVDAKMEGGADDGGQLKDVKNEVRSQGRKRNLSRTSKPV